MNKNDEIKLNNKFHHLMSETFDLCKEILESRGSDYGCDNFYHAAKVASMLTGQDVRGSDVAACMIGIKMARYGNLVGGGTNPDGEPVKDTVRDWINYIVLMERERAKDAERERQRQAVQENPT